MTKMIKAKDVLDVCDTIAEPHEFSTKGLMCDDIRLFINGLEKRSGTSIDDLLLTTDEMNGLINSARAYIEAGESHTIPGPVGDAIREEMSLVFGAIDGLLRGGTA